MKPAKKYGLRVYIFTNLQNYITKTSINATNCTQILTISVKRIFSEVLVHPKNFPYIMHITDGLKGTNGLPLRSYVITDTKPTRKPHKPHKTDKPTQPFKAKKQ